MKILEITVGRAILHLTVKLYSCQYLLYNIVRQLLAHAYPALLPPPSRTCRYLKKIIIWAIFIVRQAGLIFIEDTVQVCGMITHAVHKET